MVAARRTPTKSKNKRRIIGQLVPGKHKPDYTLLITVFLLLLFGVIMVFDASIVFAHEQFGDSFHFLKAEILWVLLGSIACYVAYKFDYHRLKKLAIPVILATLILLIAVFIPGIGIAANGSHRWINLGIGVLQSSEVAKLSFVIYLSAWLARTREKRSLKNLGQAFSKHTREELLPFLIVLGVVGVLVMIEPDLGSTMIIGLTSLAIYFISGTDIIHTLGSILIVLVLSLLAVFAAVLSPYRLERVTTFLPLLLRGEVDDPLGAGYQIKQILIAVGSGGLFGLGFGESRQKFQYLVETTAVTDSIFAVIAEELGFVGSVLVLGMFALFMYRGYMITKHAPDRLGMLLATGITFWLGIQAVLNIAANVALIPLTGITLPFISYGGSSLIVTMAAVGILLNISSQTKD